MLGFGAVLSVYKRTTHHVPLRVVDRHVTTPMVITAILSEQPFAARSRETVPICWDSEAQFENAFRNWGKTGGPPYHTLELEGCASQQNRPLDFRNGSKPVSLEVSKCFPVCPRKPTLLSAVGTAEKCHFRTHARNI
jgi:hypothetical protein